MLLLSRPLIAPPIGGQGKIIKARDDAADEAAIQAQWDCRYRPDEIAGRSPMGLSVCFVVGEACGIEAQMQLQLHWAIFNFNFNTYPNRAANMPLAGLQMYLVELELQCGAF